MPAADRRCGNCGPGFATEAATGDRMKLDCGTALGFALGLALLPAAAPGQVFKCKDADGKVTYTDVPCLRSETGTVVDVRSSVADYSSLRKEAARLPASEPAPPPQGQSPSAGSPAPAEQPGRRNEPRTSGYSR
ncbi:MAG TPA: DUF4124 domain-containing protein [Burkholderiaceae bacterium]|nr:DUF4124 domain-containing protein [Burkholderiaceae bacterium]